MSQFWKADNTAYMLKKHMRCLGQLSWAVLQNFNVSEGPCWSITTRGRCLCEFYSLWQSHEDEQGCEHYLCYKDEETTAQRDGVTHHC